jgi:transposase
MEKHSGFVSIAPSAIVTELILLLIDAGYTNTDIARITGPDESTVRRIRDKRDSVQVVPAHRHPEFLGVDEWKHCDQREMRAILVDVGNKMPVDLFDACKADNLALEPKRLLVAHPEVRAIVIDMSGAFRNLLQKGFPDLIIVVDHYHVKQALESAFPCTPLAEN